VDAEAIAQFRKLQALVRAIRNARAEYKVGRVGGREGGKKGRDVLLSSPNFHIVLKPTHPPSLPPSLGGARQEGGCNDPGV